MIFFTNSLGKEATDDMITAMIMTYQEGVPTVPNLVPETLLASEYRVCYHPFVQELKAPRFGGELLQLQP